MKTIKVILADDHQIVRNGIKMLVEGSEVSIIDEASNGKEVLEKLEINEPNLVLMDISMPIMNGLEATKEITKSHPNVSVLILSMFDSEEYILSAVESGAKGYLLKDAPKEEILKAIRLVAEGEKYFNSSVSNIIINGYLKSKQKSDSEDNSTKLSNKEKVILKHIVKGQNSREIAESLDLSVRTVDNHRANMMKKLAVKNAVELVKTAIEKRLV